MHRCYPGKCGDGFHYTKTGDKSFEVQKAEHFRKLKAKVDAYYEKDLPRPDNFNVVDFEQCDSYLVVKINYPNCTNYDGDKILVVQATVKDLVTAKHIDPHFAATKPSEKRALPSPAARFPPTAEGWKNACLFAHALTTQKH